MDRLGVVIWSSGFVRPALVCGGLLVAAAGTVPAQDSPHGKISFACEECHTTNPGWAPSTYSHASATPKFPQDGRHTTAACAKCHQTATNYTQYCCQSSGCHNSCQGGG
jgi:hypothetical protein